MDTKSESDGFGLGMRLPHQEEFLAGTVDVDFVEVISENFMVDGGRPLRVLADLRMHYPVFLHGVSLSVGSADGLDPGYLKRLRQLVRAIEPHEVSDHLCWTRTSAHSSHDLLPLPRTREALDVVCDNLARTQDYLQRPLMLENPSSYLGFAEDEMPEWEFLAEITRRTGCGLLLDVNNVYVSAVNHGFCAREYISGLPLNRVRQVHLAGHTPGEILIDTHDRDVCEEVWALYRLVMLSVQHPVATMIERDDAIPPLADLLRELAVARSIAGDALEVSAA
jgi:uncharacterized protein (UPF0276 family)